ncbi:MAG: D-alanyl-D-alanine carboxypeptidase/D-alanyl-D-alanine-endopeptidase [Chlorobiales bacterium]|nr:D-alanyl-D-alanine carboxypeptidase/D-alanyl-D-alanine-endopeptidase [Chlorobiales bacterium]
MGQGALRSTSFGISIQTDEGEVIYEQNPTRPVKPASNLKLVTTAVALEKLGPEFRFQTDIFYDGYLTYGVLHGNLIISGSTDPVLSGYFDGRINDIVRQLVDTLYTLGIHEIRGDVILDNSYYVGDEVIEADEDYLPISFSTVASFSQANSSQMGRVSRVRVIRTRHGKKRVVRSGFSRGSRLRRVTIEPNVYMTNALLKEFQSRNMVLSNGIEKVNNTGKIDRTTWKHIYTHYSEPLSRILMRTNKNSDNFYADQLLRTLGGELHGEASIEKGIAAVEQFLLYSVGVDRREFTLADGSGLSHENLVTPNLLVEVMKYMKHRSSYFTTYYESLSIPTVDGTLSSRIFHELATNIRAKTGTISGVTSLSGYLTSRSGLDIYFSIICNGSRKKTLKNVEDRICQVLLEI